MCKVLRAVDCGLRVVRVSEVCWVGFIRREMMGEALSCEKGREFSEMRDRLLHFKLSSHSKGGS